MKSSLNKIWIILSLATLLISNSIRANAAINDIFHDPDGPDRGSFFMRVNDSLNNKKISTKNRRLTIQLFFLSEFYDEINEVNNLDLAAAFNRALRVRALVKKNNDLQASKQSIRFSYKDISSEDRDKKYNRVSFRSERIVISDPQNISFNFDQEEFADYIDVSIDEDSNYNKRVKFKSLSSEVDSFDAGVADRLVTISGNFIAENELNLNSQSFEFKFKENKKTKRAIAKRKKQRIRLNAELDKDIDPKVTLVDLDDLEYQVNIPLKLKLRNSSDRRKYKNSEVYEVEIPVLMKLVTVDGLEIDIKGTVKEQLSDFISSNKD